MNSLTIVMTLMAAGGGLAVGFLLGHARGRREEAKLNAQRWTAPAVETEMFFGDDYKRRWARDDEDDHPADIERQGSHLVPAPTSGGLSARAYGERYNGMDDQRVLD